MMSTSGSTDIEGGNDGKVARLSWSHVFEDVDLRRADWPLMICSFLCGLVDSVAFNASSVFVSMQTGNTIFIALGAATLPVGQPHIWARALVSVAAFWLGCWLFAFSSRQFGPRRKLTLSASFLLQAILTLISAAMAQTDVAPAFGYRLLDPNDGVQFVDRFTERKLQDEDHFTVYIVVALLAFQSAGQIVLSRTLGYNEVPSVVVTSLYCDLLSDPKLFSLPLGANVKRNRRLIAVLLLVAGGILGGWLQRTRAGMPGALWMAAALKLIISVAWLVWKGADEGNSTL